MGGMSTLLLFYFIVITHFFAGNGDPVPHTEPLPVLTAGGGSASQPPLKESLITFRSRRLQMVYKVIQNFKKKVTYDPKRVTRTWKGGNICAYKGFICDIVPRYNQTTVAGINFNGLNFNGPNLTLTEFLIGFPDLVFFHANSNNFTGSLPSNLNKLPYFVELDLSNNNFTSRFPFEVLRANKLLFLDLRFNTFAGTVPGRVFGLTLDLLFINNNNFIQTLPRNLGNTTSLYLTLANNKFVGGIPPSIGRASNTLLEVLFLNNKLTGCLPYQIGLLKKATVFDVGFNKLHGRIPLSFQCLRKMEILNLAHNKFSGVVPESVCSLPVLTNFTVSYNYFTQVGPQCRKLIRNGVLNVKMNCISGLPNQRSAQDCRSFFSGFNSTCPNRRSFSFVPCRQGLSYTQIESSDVQSPVALPAPTPELAPGPRKGSYEALSPH